MCLFFRCCQHDKFSSRGLVSVPRSDFVRLLCDAIEWFELAVVLYVIMLLHKLQNGWFRLQKFRFFFAAMNLNVKQSLKVQIYQLIQMFNAKHQSAHYTVDQCIWASCCDWRPLNQNLNQNLKESSALQESVLGISGPEQHASLKSFLTEPVINNYKTKLQLNA